MLLLTPVGPEAAEVLAGLHSACLEPAWSSDSIRALQSFPGTCAWIAQWEGKPAGFILIRAAGDEAEILALGVLVRFRRRGLARRLIVEAGNHLRGRGVSRVFLEVSSCNEAAIDLYRGVGFVLAGGRPGYYRKGDGWEDAHVFRLDLGLSLM